MLYHLIDNHRRFINENTNGEFQELNGWRSVHSRTAAVLKYKSYRFHVQSPCACWHICLPAILRVTVNAAQLSLPETTACCQRTLSVAGCPLLQLPPPPALQSRCHVKARRSPPETTCLLKVFSSDLPCSSSCHPPVSNDSHLLIPQLGCFQETVMEDTEVL